MGSLRTLFALSVVFYHSWPGRPPMVGGPIAVQCFYIISGFLISYILVELRSYPTLRTFYINRYLRLYPIYFFVAVLSLIAILATHRASFMEVYETAPASAVSLLVLANAFLFGQDWIMFCGVRDHALVFVTNFLHSDVVLYKGQIIHPAWTLGVELSFYLIAPFVLPRRKLIYALIGLSLGLRLLFLHLGFGARDPWSYRFFPTELALFLFGALAHQVLLPLYKGLGDRRGRLASNAALLFLVSFSLVYPLLPIDEIVKRLFLLAALGCLVPLTFMFQQNHRLDGWVGNLSYPIYIGHLFVLWNSSYVLKHAGISDERVISLVGVVLTVGFAVFLNAFVAAPFEKLRRTLKSRARLGTPRRTAAAPAVN